LIHDVDSSQQPISIIKEFTKSQEQPSGVVLSMSWSDDSKQQRKFDLRYYRSDRDILPRRKQ